MTTTARPDIELIPAQYTWVGYSDDGDGDDSCGRLLDGPLFAIHGADQDEAAEAREFIRTEVNPSGVRNAIHPGGCDACGQMGLRYRHYFRHDPTGDVIVLGDQCVVKMDFASITDYQAAKRVATQRERELQIAAEAKWKTANPEAAEVLEGYADEHHIIGDMARKLRRYGSLSERQVEFLYKLRDEVNERHDTEAQREREAAEATPIPAELLEGRHQVSGEIVYGDWRETEFGESYKIIVRDDRGFKLWGTAAEALWGEDGLPNGTRVTFHAAIVGADDDPAFGFYKRPTKAARVEDGAEQSEQAEEPARPSSLLADLED